MVFTARITSVEELAGCQSSIAGGTTSHAGRGASPAATTPPALFHPRRASPMIGGPKPGGASGRAFNDCGIGAGEPGPER